jgi:hypothetical protein
MGRGDRRDDQEPAPHRPRLRYDARRLNDTSLHQARQHLLSPGGRATEKLRHRVAGSAVLLGDGTADQADPAIAAGPQDQQDKRQPVCCGAPAVSLREQSRWRETASLRRPARADESLQEPEEHCEVLAQEPKRRVAPGCMGGREGGQPALQSDDLPIRDDSLGFDHLGTTEEREDGVLDVRLRVAEPAAELRGGDAGPHVIGEVRLREQDDRGQAGGLWQDRDCGVV